MEHYVDHTERLVTINKLLPELERFLRYSLTTEQLSEKANAQREEFLVKLVALNKPPRLPPRPPEPPQAGVTVSSDYLSQQREISWRQNDPKRVVSPEGLPYQNRRRQPSEEIGAPGPGFHDGSSTSEDSNLLYARIPNETGSDKYVDINDLANDNKPAIPERSPRLPPHKPIVENLEVKRNSWRNSANEIYLQKLGNPTRSGPLSNIRTKTKYWAVLKKRNLYLFRDMQQPCDHIIDVSNYDIHVESSASQQFRLSKPGSPSFLLAAEDKDDHRGWVEALENCKYVDIENEMPRRAGQEKGPVEDPAYEEPRDVINKMQQKDQGAPKSPNDLYVDMNGGQRKPSNDYVDPSQHDRFYDKLSDLVYDAELPPVPLSSGEEELGENDTFTKLPSKNPIEPSSDGNITGSYSSSEDEPPPLPENRNSSMPVNYNLNNTSVNSLERKKSSSLGRKLEKDAFFKDPDALHVGILHQKRFLSVGKKRYCKVKNEILYVFRNPDNDEKPLLEVMLHDVKVEPCEKETWKNNAFKIVQPGGETVYFAAETREGLMHWLKILVLEADKEKFSSKDLRRFPNRDLLAPIDTIDSASNSSLERKERAEESEGTTTDSAATGSEASDQESSHPVRQKSFKRRNAFENSPSQKKRGIDVDGYLHLEKAGKWVRHWCRVKAKIFEVHSSKPSKSPEKTVPLAESVLITFQSKIIQKETNLFLIKLAWAEESLVLLAKDMLDWKKWFQTLKKLTKGLKENCELDTNLPDLPLQHQKGGRESKPKKKKTVKNGHLKPTEAADAPTEMKQFRGKLTRLADDADETGADVCCEARDGFFFLANDALLEDKIIEVPIRKIKLHQKKLSVKNDRHIFGIQTVNEIQVILAVNDEKDLLRLIDVLWLLNAQVDGERGTVVNNRVNQLKKQYKRRSIAFEPLDLIFEPPERSVSDDDHKRKSSKTPMKTEGRRPTKPSSSGRQSGGSRMSSLFKSLPRLRQKKYDFNASDSVDGVPKIQFSGNVLEVKINEEGVEQLVDRHCKVSGKIFYASVPGSDLKPIFKVPLRNATIEEMIDKESNKFGFILSSMEDRATFKFFLTTEEEFDNWSNALYMIDSKSVPGRMSSRESLLDDSKSDADIDARPEAGAPAGFPGSNSNSSISSMASKQGKPLTGNNDEANASIPRNETNAIPRKVSEEVFTTSADHVLHSGFLYEVKISESNGIKSRTKLRRWCSLKQSWIEIYNNKNDKVPMRGIAIQHHTFENLNSDDLGEKWALGLKSNDEVLILCANNEEDFVKWQQEFRKVSKRSSRKASDTAKLKLKSAGEGIRQLLSSSSLSGLSKRDSKRSTIVLNDDDKNIVDTFTKDIESGNKISGVLTIIAANDKPSKPKKRFCVIRDGKFCIAKRSKPQKAIQTIELSNVDILDESDIDKGIFRFRLDFGQNESLIFQAVDESTADNWMVAISMGMLLERLTSPEKFPQHGEPEAEMQSGLHEANELDQPDASLEADEDARDSASSNLSNDIKAAIDSKIVGGSNYLNPLSDLLESAFTPGPYSESSTPSSREGTLERNLKGKKGPRCSSGEAIMEEEDEFDSQISEDSPSVQGKIENVSDLPKPGSVTEAISAFEKMTPPSNERGDDNVFGHGAGKVEDDGDIKILTKAREDLEKKKLTIVNNIAELENDVETSKPRVEQAKEAQENNTPEEHHDAATKELEAMRKKLCDVDKTLLKVDAELQKRRSKGSLRGRSAVISSHVIV